MKLLLSSWIFFDVLVLLLKVLDLPLEVDDLFAHYLQGSGLHVEVALHAVDVGVNGSPECGHLLTHCACHLVGVVDRERSATLGRLAVLTSVLRLEAPRRRHAVAAGVVVVGEHPSDARRSSGHCCWFEVESALGLAVTEQRSVGG